MFLLAVWSGGNEACPPAVSTVTDTVIWPFSAVPGSAKSVPK